MAAVFERPVSGHRVVQRVDPGRREIQVAIRDARRDYDSRP
jgi:hypothetical protein